MNLTESQGLLLVELAYVTICSKLGEYVSNDRRRLLDQQLKDEVFETSGGNFVTLKRSGSLRGCIGSLISDKTIKEGIRLNAVNAAFHDYRFTALTLEELEDIEIEVSILTTPQRLQYTDGLDLTNKLQVGIDGIILRKDSFSATFLPQVWHQLPNTEIFLAQLCLKAGLSANTWKEGDIEVDTYQVQAFSSTY